jgi:hypothetical protein
MSAKKKKRDPAARLEERLEQAKADRRRQFLNEDILRLEKNGDLSYETVRTVGTRQDGTIVDKYGRVIGHEDDEGVAVGCEANHGANQVCPVEEPNFRTETPDPQENGRLIGPAEATSPPPSEPAASTELPASQPLSDEEQSALADSPSAPTDRISDHEGQNRGQKIAPHKDDTRVPVGRAANHGSGDAESPSAVVGCAAHSHPDADPLDELLSRASSKRRGRPAAFDEHNKGKLVALLSLGMSLRQAAAVLGVAHSTIASTLKADRALAEEITAARFQAQLQPLACVIREARRSWKAATWLLKYLDAKIAAHEETPEERRERQQQEMDEFMGRSTTKGVKKRKEWA